MERISNGVWPTMITPFTSDNKIDWKSLDKLIEWYIESGVSGLFAVCLSSEIFNLSYSERIALAEHIVKRVNNRVQIVSGALLDDNLFTNNIKEIYDIGVNTVVLLSGQVYRENDSADQSLIRIDKLLSSTGNIPLGIYESPKPYHRILNKVELQHLISSERFYFMKDTSCDIKVISSKLQVIKNSNCCFFNANTPTLLESLKLGASGYCGIAANFYPELYNWLCKNYKTKPKPAEELSDFLRISDFLIHNRYPVSAKTYLNISGIKMNAFSRAANTSLSKAEMNCLKSLQKNIKKLHIELGIERTL